ncbi:cell surface protein [Pleomassaria siparia CBS 279.74]|uniref:Cell surface protein n=1 Tax=Pleomassaria siparia CBS 279.74 TaxID=1314801 RepID=A0A6G1K709_9PLEO|nr:cell surface protein [Pleomassaria siparia CBS 279.74]
MLINQITLAVLVTYVSAHGTIVRVNGANNVTMPGLTVADGTPRDCSSNRCGSQADTAIIRDREIASGKCGPLGRTQGNGPVDAGTMIAAFMGTGTAPTNDGAASSVGVEDKVKTGKQRGLGRRLAGLLSGLGGGGGDAGDKALGKSELGPPEAGVAAAAGQGAASGLPTANADGTVDMIFRQVNQDGAGPFTADIDGTSGGTEEAAFQSAEVTKDVPGFGVQGLSLATSTEFDMQIKMPAGMTCDGTAGGVDNVCVARVRNGAAAGPFGGSAAFTQTAAARKRAIAHRKREALKKRVQIGGRV